MPKVTLLAPFLLASLAFAPAAAAQDQKVEWWQKDFDGALAAAKEAPAGMLLLYCWTDPNDNCSAMFSGTMADPKSTPLMLEFVCMGAKKTEDAGRQLIQRYRVDRLPTVLFLTPEATVVDAIVGYVPIEKFTAEVERIKKGEKTVAALRKAAAEKPDDLDLQIEYVRKLRATGDRAASLLVIDAIVAKDPKCKGEQAAEAMLHKLSDEVFVDDKPPQDWDLEPLYAFLRQQKNKRILFLGYERLADAEYVRDDLKSWAKFMERAWKSVPADRALDFGQNVASLAYQRWKDLDKLDKSILKLALKISEKALEEVAKEHKKTPDKSFMANAMYLHAAVLNVNNKRKEAFALMDEAIATDPANENLKRAKEQWVDGAK